MAIPMGTSVREAVVRPLKGSDTKQLLAILRKAFKREMEIGGFDIQRFERNARLYRLMRFLVPVLDLFGRDYPTILVATQGNDVVGEVHLNPFARKMWTIDSLAVDPARGKQGVGSVLIKESVDYLEKREAKKVLSSMRADNIPANKIAQKLGYTIFEERTTLIGELDALPKSHRDDVLVREAESRDVEQILEIAKAVDTARIQMFETSARDFAGSLLQIIMDEIMGTHSQKFVAESQSMIVGYAQSVCTSPIEAARIEPLYLSASNDPFGVACSMLAKIAEHLLAKKTTKVITSVAKGRKETIGILTRLGFTPVANMNWYTCFDRRTEQKTK